ncbi:MAG: GAF domain-containing protein [Symploca sp. SIO2E9]|nr:GAF domain-containing protein [Symploca sp. SIO2E9]
MATWFDPDPKAYNQQANGQGHSSLNGVQQNGLNGHSNSQTYTETNISRPVVKEINMQQMSMPPSQQNSSLRIPWWHKLRLQQKVTALAVVLSTLPVVLIGGVAYQLADEVITNRVTNTKLARVVSMEDKVKRFLLERYGDIEILSQLPMLTDPALRASTSPSDKVAQLDQFKEASQVYDLISVVDPQGKLIVQTTGEEIPNQSSRQYFKEVRKTDKPVIGNAIKPAVSNTPDRLTLHFAAPVKDKNTGNTVAIIRARVPVQHIGELLAQFSSDGDQFYLIDRDTGKIVVANQTERENQIAEDIYPEIEKLRAAGKTDSKIILDQIDKEEDLFVYDPLRSQEGLPELKWEAAIATPIAIAFEAKSILLQTVLGGTILTAGLVSLLAVYLANRATRPVLVATNAVKKMGQGDLNLRLQVTGEDELAILGSNINLMADQLGNLLEKQQASLEQAQLFADIATSSAKKEDRSYILDLAAQGAKKLLKADRVVVYGFESDFSGSVIAEAVDPGWSRALADQTSDPCITPELIGEFKKGRVVPTNDIREHNYSLKHVQLLDRLQVKANLVTPIVSGGELMGLLIAHQCSGTRVWQPSEVNFLKDLGAQVGISLTSAKFISQKEAEVSRAQQLNDITSGIREALNPEDIYQRALAGVRETLSTDRVIVYLFDENWQGTIVAESVASVWPKTLGAKIADPCFADNYVEKYKRGRVLACEDIDKANLTDCHLSQLQPFKVRANLVGPIIAYGRLHGLLITHQCSAPRRWQESEISFFKQVALQIGSALDQSNFLEQQQQARLTAEANSEKERQQKEELQLKLLSLLDDVEGAARGDLTVRAEVTSGEIGTVADFFNSIVESLREIVTQVKQSAMQVNTAIEEDERAIRQLSAEALQQVQETTRTLESIEQMTLSIQAVAESATQAASVASSASETAEIGQETMDLTVYNIMGLRTTVAETAKKVKRLGESSQEISKVVALIHQIALQTNLLAINAGIEAARAGEEGQGFAVVAEEVGELAKKSASATREIEQIVESIQLETAQVLEAMEDSTTQVVEGTRLVEQTKHSLGHILNVSRQIDQLVQSISEATDSQTETSQQVRSLMQEIATASARTSDSSDQVAISLQQTVEVAQQLQTSVGAFKVEGG